MGWFTVPFASPVVRKCHMGYGIPWLNENAVQAFGSGLTLQIA